MYAYFIHRIGKTKHEIVAKYEFYDPNTKVSGNDIVGGGKNSFTGADIKYTQLGLGYNYYYDANVKFMLTYNIITNEKTLLSGYTSDIKDNILTVRMQYRF
jgi:phosphate-selective porin